MSNSWKCFANSYLKIFIDTETIHQNEQKQIPKINKTEGEQFIRKPKKTKLK